MYAMTATIVLWRETPCTRQVPPWEFWAGVAMLWVEKFSRHWKGSTCVSAMSVVLRAEESEFLDVVY